MSDPAPLPAANTEVVEPAVVGSSAEPTAPAVLKASEPKPGAERAIAALGKIGEPTNAPKPTAESTGSANTTDKPTGANAPADNLDDEAAVLAGIESPQLQGRLRKQIRARKELSEQLAKIKESSGAAVQRMADLDDYIAGLGASPDEIAAQLDALRTIKSGSPVDKRTLLNGLRTVMEKLSLELGEAPIGVDIMARHPDLAAKVEAMTLTAEDALETATLRERGKLQSAAQEQNEQRRRAQHEQQQAREVDRHVFRQAVSGINEFEKQVMATDPDAGWKIERIRDLVSGGLFKDVRPEQLLERVRSVYQSLKVPPKVNGATGPQPLPRAGVVGGLPLPKPTDTRSRMLAALQSVNQE